MLFHKKYQTTIIACILFVISLIVLTYSVNKSYEAGFFRKLALEATALLVKAVNIPIHEVENVWKRYLFLVGLEEENRRLKRENSSLANELLQYREGYLEGVRLQRMLKLQEKLTYPSIAARVIAKSQTALIKTVLIDKGTADGLKPGLPVLAERGTVGRITEASWHASKVLLLIDETSNIDASLQGGRNQGILQGDGLGTCMLKYIPKTETVKLGDIVISSGLSGIFPKGSPLGVVTHIDNTDHGLFQKVKVAPYVDVAKLEEILVLLIGGDIRQ
jgi:rod shape-determining protein MreC